MIQPSALIIRITPNRLFHQFELCKHKPPPISQLHHNRLIEKLERTFVHPLPSLLILFFPPFLLEQFPQQFRPIMPRREIREILANLLLRKSQFTF